MRVKRAFTFLWKLMVSAFAFVAGLMLGGMLTASLGLQAPRLPAEIDTNATMVLMFATSPLLVLALYVVNRELAGGWRARSAMLFLLTWIAYSLNNVIEAAIFTSYETASGFTIVNFLPAVLLCAAVTAWLFPAHGSDKALIATWREYFQQRTVGDWAWRLLLAAVIFMPIYYLFGMMVVPFVGEYYQQGAFGLAAPPLPTLLLVLFVRSVLFLIACLPVVVAWQGGRLQLTASLGFALFVLVGFLYMLAASWIAPSVRFVHSLEILADSLVYAAALVWLLSGHNVEQHKHSTLTDSFSSTASQPRKFVG